MKTTIFNLLFAGLFISAAVLSSCSKSEAINDLNNKPQQLSASQQANITTGVGISNQDLVIIYATDGAANITQEFKDFTFHFEGSGLAYVWNDLLSQRGSWSMREGSGFSMSYPADIFTQLVFLNRQWTITESATGSTVFRLISGDGDEVHFSVK